MEGEEDFADGDFPKEADFEELFQRNETHGWRQALLDFLDFYIMEDTMYKALLYISNMMHAAIHICIESRGVMDPGAERLIQFEENCKPVAFPLEKWRRLVASLGLSVEEPDRNSEAMLCSVKLPSGASVRVLMGVCTLIDSLLVIDYPIVRGLINLQKEDAYLLIELLNSLRGENLVNCQRYDRLVVPHAGVLQSLGLRVVQEGPHARVLHNPRPGGVKPRRVLSVLLALFSQMSSEKMETWV